MPGLSGALFFHLFCIFLSHYRDHIQAGSSEASISDSFPKVISVSKRLSGPIAAPPEPSALSSSQKIPEQTAQSMAGTLLLSSVPPSSLWVLAGRLQAGGSPNNSSYHPHHSNWCSTEAQPCRYAQISSIEMMGYLLGGRSPYLGGRIMSEKEPWVRRPELHEPRFILLHNESARLTRWLVSPESCSTNISLRLLLCNSNDTNDRRV